MFPKSSTWITQWSCAHGDKSKTQDNVLNKVLSSLATVIVQYGIYYIRAFPDHEASQLLKHSMPNNFELYAKNARQEIEAKQQLLNMKNTQDLNKATRYELKLVLTLAEQVFQDKNTDIGDLIN